MWTTTALLTPPGGVPAYDFPIHPVVSIPRSYYTLEKADGGSSFDIVPIGE